VTVPAAATEDAVSGDQADLLEPLAAGTEGDGGSQESQQSDASTDDQSSTDVADAEASTADGVKEAETPLEAVMAALGDDAPDPSPGSESEGKDTEQSEAKVAEGKEAKADDAEADDTDQEPEAQHAEDKLLPFADHPRFKQLLARDRERKQLKEELEPLKVQVTTLEPKAKHYDDIVKYAQQSNFGKDDFTNLLEMGRLMKNDPIAFHKAFQPHWAKIEEQAGARLPEDIQKRVTEGLLDPESAAELAKQRAQAQVSSVQASRATQQLSADREQTQRNDTERQQNERVNAIGSSVTAWEKQWKTSDPDYSRKQPLVMDRVMRLLQETPPTSTEDALALCSKAKTEIEAHLRSAMPTKPSIRPSNSGPSVDTKGQPATALDAAMAVHDA
jgi:hypothetical protein